MAVGWRWHARIELLTLGISDPWSGKGCWSWRFPRRIKPPTAAPYRAGQHAMKEFAEIFRKRLSPVSAASLR
jgi:hypothetical protein